MSVTNEISETGQVIYDSSTSKKINTLLNSPKTRVEGLELLNSYLPQCSDDDFIKYCVSWMQNCCKIDGVNKNRDYGINLLGTLFKLSSNYQELKKSVSFFITTRYFDYVFKYFPNSNIGWACTEICIICYRGACGPFQETLEKNLKDEVMKYGKISPTISRCFALLPTIGGGGNENLNYWKNWKTQFRKLLSVCHSILAELFADVEEFQEYESCDDWAADEKLKNPEYLTFQLYNYCSILSEMLLCKYPTPKAVPSDLVFQIICRGLNINPKSLGKRQTTDIIALQRVLPEIHIILLSLFKALIVTCKNQLLPYAYLVCKLLRQGLEWTGSDISTNSEKPFGFVRIAIYETLCNWLVATRCGGCVETIGNVVVVNATSDISTKKDVVVLKESKQKHQHKESGNRRVNPKANERLCFVALKALQFLLKFVGILLKPEEHKFLQEFTVKLLVDLQKTPTSDMPIPFSVSKCRQELYSLLVELVQHPCPKWPPPTHFALRLLRKGVADECVQVSFLCSSALSVIINIIHPQFTNGGFPPSETPETRRDWASQPMEIDVVIDPSQSENHEKTLESDTTEKISDLDKSDSSVEEGDSVNTEPFTKESERLEVQEEYEELEILESAEENGTSEDKEMSEEVEKFTEETSLEPSPKKRRISEEIKDKTPVEEINTPEKKETPTKKINTPEKKETPVKEKPTPEKEKETPEKVKFSPENETQNSVEKEIKKSEDSGSAKSVTPEVSEEIKPKKTYFLRSKTKGSSEEPDEARSPDNLRNTPLRGLKATPRRPKTRALSKAESESETESKTTKKSEDDEDDIMASFDDSIIE